MNSPVTLVSLQKALSLPVNKPIQTILKQTALPSFTPSPIIKQDVKKRLENIKSINLKNCSDLIRLNSISNRPVEAKSAFDLMVQSGITPDIISYNYLIDAYARVADVKNAQLVFDQISNNKLSPNEFSKSILVKAYVNANDITTALTLESSWRKNNLIVPQSVYTTIIRGLLAKKNFRRAWKVFEFIQSKGMKPDVKTYSMMLHACALDQEAEKALDLFTRMAEEGIQPTTITFNSLINACGSRADYYLEAFRIFQQMLIQGFVPQIDTFTLLLDVCANHGDLQRALDIWNELVDSINKDSKLELTNDTVIAMIKVFYRYLKLKNQGDLKIQPPVITTLEESNLENKQDLFRFQPSTTGSKSILNQAEKFYRWSIEKGFKQDLKMLNSMLAVYSNSGPTKTLNTIAFFRGFKELNVEPNGKSYQLVLESITTGKVSMKKYGTSFWNEFLEWDRIRDQECNSDDVRNIQKRGKNEMFKNFVLMVRGYALYFLFILGLMIFRMRYQ